MKNIEDWDKVAKDHAEFFGKIRPAILIIGVNRFTDQILVEIEADAIVEQPT